MDPALLPFVVGLGVIVSVVFAGLVLHRAPSDEVEHRLDTLTGKVATRTDPKQGILLRPETLDFSGASFGRLIPNADALAQLYEQANVAIPFQQFLCVPVALSALGALLGLVLHLSIPAALIGAFSLGILPFLWLVLRKRKRIKQFLAQMPDALELVGRALRAGHGLASGLHVVAEEMAPPIADEFGRIFEEQNLGIPLEDALRGLAERVPTMEVRFFVTAVVIQRATGGDLAEILDKIGRLIRERFQILGQVQALTGEGRLSGIVLLALPPCLLAFLYMTNPEYIGLLFNTTMGVKMLLFAGTLQILGAVAIKKIVTIKV
jgi:tight adherence protein B